MLTAFMITLREGIEAFLIVAITLAWLRKTGRGTLATVRIARRLPAAITKNTSRGSPWSISAPKMSGERMPARLKPLVTKPNTVPNEPGGVTSRTSMSRGGMIAPVQKPENDTKYDLIPAGWGADWANASTVLPELFTKEGGFNLSNNWDDPAYAAFKSLMVKGLAETNRAKQAAIWKQGSQYVMDQYWIIRPVFSKTQFAWGSGVGGVDYWEPQGNYLFPTMYVKQ